MPVEDIADSWFGLYVREVADLRKAPGVPELSASQSLSGLLLPALDAARRLFDERVAVSCTGQGETFIRAGAARLVAALVERGETLQSAAAAAMQAVARCGGTGGLIAVDAHGSVVTPLSTAAMPRGVWRAGKTPITTVP